MIRAIEAQDVEEADRLAHEGTKTPAQHAATGSNGAQLPVPAAEPQLPATATDLKIPEPAPAHTPAPAESPDKRALPS